MKIRQNYSRKNVTPEVNKTKRSTIAIWGPAVESSAKQKAAIELMILIWLRKNGHAHGGAFKSAGNAERLEHVPPTTNPSNQPTNNIQPTNLQTANLRGLPTTNNPSPNPALEYPP